MKQETQKPKYNMWQNTIYMIKIACKECKAAIFHIPIVVTIVIIKNLAELFIVPMILQKIELQVPLMELLLTIGIFTLLLIFTTGAYTYMTKIVEPPRIQIRTAVMNLINNKRQTMSYPHMESTAAEKLFQDADNCCNSSWAATEMIWTTLTELLNAVFGFAIYLTLLSTLHPFLIFIIAVTSIISYFVSKHFNEWEYRHRDERAEYEKQCGYVSQKSEDRTLAKDMRIFGMQPWLDDLYSKGLSLVYGFTAKSHQQELIAKAIDMLLSFLCNGIAYVYLILQVLNTNMSASEFLLYFTAIGNFTSWVTNILTNLETLHKHSLELSVLRNFLELPEYFKFEEGETIVPDTKKDYEITLKNVSFRYPESDKYIFRNLNLTIRPGEKLAIVGLNGAGKTTLVKLICGFYDPSEGEVLLNGIDIRRYNRKDYYRHFSAVFQKFSILQTSVEINVAQSAANIEESRVRDCLEKAGLTAKISSLSNDIKTNVGRWVFEDGVEFSGGETQRLILARALYKDAPILVLDEPTAALDPISENDIYLKYSEMTKGRTSLFISHRLASTRFCDRIIFLSDGRITEEGSHDSLMKANGEYAKLFEVQSKYYKEGEEHHEEPDYVHA